jgi:hypothetical protein
MIIKVTVPADAPGDTVNVKAEEPYAAIEGVLKFAVTPGGNPVTLNAIVPPKPPTEPLVTL